MLDFLVRDVRAVWITRIRFIIGLTCLFLLSELHGFAADVIYPAHTLLIRIAMLVGTVVAIYFAPSILFKIVPFLYGGLCAFSIIGVMVFGMELSWLAPALLPMLVLSISNEWNRSKVFLLSLPAIGAAVVLNNTDALLLLGFSLCGILWLTDATEDDCESNEAATIKTHQQTITNIILLLLASIIVLLAIQRYVGRPIRTSAFLWVTITVLLMGHIAIHISIHTALLAVDTQSWAPSIVLICTALLTILTSISGAYRWVSIPYLLGCAVSLGGIYRRYELELHMSKQRAISQEEDDEMIMSLF